MTAIIAIAVNPLKVQSPYFYIVSDSRRVFKQEDDNGVLRTISIEEDYKKIHRIGDDRVFGIAGKFEDSFKENFKLKLEKSNHLNFDEFTQLAFQFIKDRIKKQPFDFARCNVVIGENRNCQPKISQFLVIKSEIESSVINKYVPKKGECFPIPLGNVQGMEDLFNEYIKRISNATDYNPLVIKRASRDYIHGVANRLPELCNHELDEIKI